MNPLYDLCKKAMLHRERSCTLLFSLAPPATTVPEAERAGGQVCAA
jgi:hypothetical protein